MLRSETVQVLMTITAGVALAGLAVVLAAAVAWLGFPLPLVAGVEVNTDGDDDDDDGTELDYPHGDVAPRFPAVDLRSTSRARRDARLRAGADVPPLQLVSVREPGRRPDAARVPRRPVNPWLVDQVTAEERLQRHPQEVA